MELIVEGQPVPKARPRVTYRQGKVWAYTLDQVRAYQEEVRMLAFNMRERVIPRDTPVRLRVTFILKGKETSRPDVVNLAATIADALEGVWYEDDSQIAELQCRKRQGPHPRAIITVEAIRKDEMPTPLGDRPHQ